MLHVIRVLLQQGLEAGMVAEGAFLMTGLELATAASEGIGVIVLVLRDLELAQSAKIQVWP